MDNLDLIDYEKYFPNCVIAQGKGNIFILITKNKNKNYRYRLYQLAVHCSYQNDFAWKNFVSVLEDEFTVEEMKSLFNFNPNLRYNEDIFNYIFH